MSDPVDALATRVERLSREGRLPRSDLTAKMRERLRPLFEAGTLAEERAGAGGQFEGAVALAENLEVFLHVERIVDAIDLALFAPGRLSGVVRDWLASPAMAGARYLHLGDYDPVGLDEYLKLKAVCPGRTDLHVPPDFEERLRRFGKEALLLDSAAVLLRLRQAPDPEVAKIVHALDRYGCGLEQEALMISMG